MGAHRSAGSDTGADEAAGQAAVDAGRTIRVRWRSVVAMVPAAVLAASGLALAQNGTPSTLTDRREVPAVPGQALTQPERSASSIDPASTGDAPVDPGLAPGLELPPGTSPGSSQPVQLDGPGIPAPALAAYRLAANLVSNADHECGIDWALVGAIGRVESNHARFGGNALDARGVARPGIIGIPLDGSNGTARIMDSDGGKWDRDTVYDRAVGPMQFIPGTWRVVGSDADGDGVRDPQDMNDAATATAVYLCSGPGDLRQSGDLYSAIRRYNNSDSYVRTVIAIAEAYRRGVTELPASSLPAAHQSGAGSTGGGSVEAGGTSTRPGRTSTGGGGAASTTRTSGGGSGGGGGGSATQPDGQPTSASVPPAGGAGSAVSSAASSAVSAVTSVVTSLVTDVVKLPTPIVTTTTPCVVDLLGVKVCTITTISSTTTTTTRTTTVTKKP
ncbi:hypothetical protein GCM10027446_09520 [Angustibacter peucedani]